jgi:hypothetical protein
MDIHKEKISIAVLNSSGKVVMESIIETKASTIVQFVQVAMTLIKLTTPERQPFQNQVVASNVPACTCLRKEL